MQKIVIIGGGLSGTLLTINLLRYTRENVLLDITVVDKNPPDMLGYAYSTNQDFHLLNVPAHKMSAFADSPGDFVNWLTTAGLPYESGSFVPRKIFREYILDTLQKELNRKKGNIHYRFLQHKAMDILSSERLLVLDSGAKIPFDKIVLALGNFKPASLRLADTRHLRHPAYFASAWEPGLFRDLAQTHDVLIIGTGLTMVDTVLELEQRGHKGHITALSTHGYTPASHLENTPAYSFHERETEGISTTLEALKMVNRHFKKARQQNISWHAVIDAIRPYTQQIWQNFPATEKIRFMEHLRHIWGVARHRMPGECAKVLHQLMAGGQLSITAGKINAIHINTDNSLSVDYLARSTKKQCALIAHMIVNCMGPEPDYEKLDDPLIRNLLEKRLMRTDKLRLGIDCTPEGIVIDGTGALSPCMYTIGPPARGALFEITSVPEIRMAALRLARLITAEKNELVY
jgi:uncharacterized NAD(P)/FAD-binding protein YdhS